MNCCIFKPITTIHRGYEYKECEAFYKGAQSIIYLINKLETENGNAKANTSTHSSTPSCESLSNASKWIVDLTEKQSFLHGLVDAYRNQTPSNILLKPGNNWSPIAAHKTLLAARSKIFKNMLELDECEAPRLETITLPELNHEELEAIIEFLYSGSLSQEKLEKHIYPLSRAAHKYEIIYLQKFSQNYMLKSLRSSNALLVLEFLDFDYVQTIIDDMLSFIVKHRRDIILSDEYEAFAAKNPHLSLQITRALLMDEKKKTIF